ncbi:MAG TPA: ABC transporter permease [Candidatus Limnocylindria bacterium]
MKPRDWMSRERVRSGAIVMPFVALFLLLALVSPPFLSGTNLTNILDQQSTFLIMAAAGTLVFVAGGIDLSVGAVHALAGVTAAQVTLVAGPVPGMVAGVGAGLIAGLANGIIVTTFRINALIATLAVSFVVSGITGLLTGGNLIVILDQADFAALARTDILGIASSTWIMVVAVVVFAILLARTTFGRYVYAVGGNPEAARLAGVPVRPVRLATFVMSGGAAGLAGVLIASRVLSAQASSGQDIAFTVLAGIVVGGTSIAGGEGAVWRTVVGVLFIALIGNGFNLLGLDALWRQIALGGLILGAVGLDAALRSGRR